MTAAQNPPAKEDVWAHQPIGAPFPPNPVKCLGSQNMYIALWYKHGNPIHGCAWNNGGVVECSFTYNKTVLKTKQQLEGQIQVLQYVGDHNTEGFWYEWIQYKERFQKTEGRSLVRCGNSLPILWKDHPEGALLGYLDYKTEIARFSREDKVYEKKGGELADMWIITRNFVGGPPFCECDKCPKEEPQPGPPPARQMVNEWLDIRVGDPWPTKPLVKALDKKMDTLPGESPEQYVALWYMAGEPVMGRVWNDNGRVAASFGWSKNEITQNIGSIQVLVNLSDNVRGFDYGWIPFKEAATFGEKAWFPVHVNHIKGDISPAVIPLEQKHILGKCDVRNEKSSVGYDGKEYTFSGQAVHNAFVLCRKAKDGYKFE